MSSLSNSSLLEQYAQEATAVLTEYDDPQLLQRSWPFKEAGVPTPMDVSTIAAALRPLLGNGKAQDIISVGCGIGLMELLVLSELATNNCDCARPPTELISDSEDGKLLVSAMGTSPITVHLVDLAYTLDHILHRLRSQPNVCLVPVPMEEKGWIPSLPTGQVLFFVWGTEAKWKEYTLHLAPCAIVIAADFTCSPDPKCEEEMQWLKVQGYTNQRVLSEGAQTVLLAVQEA
eukprot:m.367119 g.367119  ORF g.367119 m.367119 type:complete len:232 (+) comp39274_c0_seq1:87-782(+)